MVAYCSMLHMAACFGTLYVNLIDHTVLFSFLGGSKP